MKVRKQSEEGPTFIENEIGGIARIDTKLCCVEKLT
jgi:hypothetical protein